MSTSNKFKDYYKETKEKLEQKIKEFNKDIIKDDAGLINNNLKQFSILNSDGKLVRGVLVNLGYYLLKDDKDYSLDLSLAYEVFQTAILVHDDIIDNDNTRGGKDTVLPFNVKHNLVNNKDIENNILEIYRLKTSHYTIIGPISVGLLLAGGEEEKIKDIEEFGTKVGIAFQIQDDILGIYSNETGKVKGTDIKEFKQTVLYSHIINTEYKDELMKYYGKNDISEENIVKVQELFKKSGSYEYAVNKMNSLYDDSLETLNNIKWIKEDKKELLRGFVEYLRNRNK